MNINFPDEHLAKMWEDIDWQHAEQKLADLQEQLSISVYRKNDREREILQQRIVNDLDIKCLAVRHVVKSSMSPGVDGVKWRKPEEMMRAAMSLSSKDYHASPMRQIIITAKNTGKQRHPRLPTYYDRAMNVLYGYSLIPVTEALGERKSFAFRPGRSMQDAHAYVMDTLKGPNAPPLVVCADVKEYYAHIQHSWLLAHAPMDKQVLREFLSAGIVFAGELFPSDGIGISEGSNISPYLGNFVLDGLQKYIYMGLYGVATPEDYANGNLIRFADDILVNVRTEDDAKKVILLIKSFLEERGLSLSMEKTQIRKVSDGFVFLSRRYYKQNGVVYCEPAEKAVERFIEELRTTIISNRKSQRELILLLNKKLKGWAAYHRYSDATEAFRRIDAAVQAALLEAMMSKHPKMNTKKLQDKYWYRANDGRYFYALPNDKSIRVYQLVDTLLLTHKKIKSNVNPFVDREYVEDRSHERDIQNVTGKYKAVWERQDGRCYYCGRPILVDQPRTIVPLDLRYGASTRNAAYVHKICAPNDCEVIQSMDDFAALRTYDVYTALEGISQKSKGRSKKEITPSWHHYGLKMYFSKCTGPSVTLDFGMIEKIDGKPLPASARKHRDLWYPRDNCNTIAEAWLTEGYRMSKLDMEKEKITLHRVKGPMSHLVIPPAILNKKLPDDAIFELETHMEYVIKKYGL